MTSSKPQQALFHLEPEKPKLEYDKSKWYFETNHDDTTRYVLGEIGDNPLFTFGVNSSTARPDNLDPTLNRVKTFSQLHNYNSWIMFNLYGFRATNPNDMHKELDKEAHEKNLYFIDQYLSKKQNPIIWAAWGTLIKKRPYLKECLKDIIEITERHNSRWITIGKHSTIGNHPHHPLYLPIISPIEDFDIKTYFSTL